MSRIRQLRIAVLSVCLAFKSHGRVLIPSRLVPGTDVAYSWYPVAEVEQPQLQPNAQVGLSNPLRVLAMILLDFSNPGFYRNGLGMQGLSSHLPVIHAIADLKLNEVVGDRAPADAMSASSQERDTRLQHLLEIAQRACESLAELVQIIYNSHLTKETTDKKADASAFTIADGLVQHLLKLLLEGKVGHIVGEEDDSNVELVPGQRYTVDEMAIPDNLQGVIDEKVEAMQQLRQHIDPDMYKDLAAFIDPIDGTKEFINKLGEQCTICLGFSDADSGQAVAGIVYRPITGTWAVGAASENFKDSNLAPSGNGGGFLASRGTLSQFTTALQTQLGMDFERVGGAGNKILLLLEGHGAVYIQDRGLNRWDTCAGEAVLDAFGGRLVRLDGILEDGRLQPYIYKESMTNMDFQPLARPTKYNSCPDRDPSAPVDVNTFKPYSNICGLFALAPSEVARLDSHVAAAQRAHAEAPAQYD